MTSPADHPPGYVRIATGSRLHFGLLDTAAPFGGVGVMIDQPATEIVVSPAVSFRCSESQDRVREIAQRYRQFQGQSALPACEVQVTQRATPHHGLGTGTQLALAVAEGLAVFSGQSVSDEILTTQIAQRGVRSAVGSHGYFRGGMIYEGSQSEGELNRVQQRIELPNEWRVLVFRPAQPTPTMSGSAEQNQFDQLGRAPASQREVLQRIIVDELLPAAQQADLAAFGDALHRYNHGSGMLFRSVQGGPYSSQPIADLVSHLQASGATGVGQSSWGPSVFSWFESDEAADAFAAKVSSSQVGMMKCCVQNEPRTLVTQQ